MFIVVFRGLSFVKGVRIVVINVLDRVQLVRVVFDVGCVVNCVMGFKQIIMEIFEFLVSVLLNIFYKLKLIYMSIMLVYGN